MVKELNKPKTKRRNRYILRICYAETSTDLIAFEQDHFKSVVPCLQKTKNYRQHSFSPALSKLYDIELSLNPIVRSNGG